MVENKRDREEKTYINGHLYYLRYFAKGLKEFFLLMLERKNCKKKQKKNEITN